MDQEVRRQVLSRIDEGRARTPVILYVIGLVFVAAAITALAGGAGLLPAWMPELVYLCVGMLFLYVGALVQERQRLGRAFRELLEAFDTFNASIYGKDFKVQRQAVELLIRTLDSEDASVRDKVHAQLVRITGQQLPAESEPWERWWRQNKATFSRDSPGASG